MSLSLPRVGAIFAARLTRRGLGGEITFDPLFLECSGVFVICKVSIGPNINTAACADNPGDHQGFRRGSFALERGRKGITVIVLISRGWDENETRRVCYSLTSPASRPSGTSSPLDS